MFALACACAAPVLALCGCGAASGGAPRSASVAAVTERDFHIAAPTRLHAGVVELRVHNEGPDEHELIVAPMNGSGLPIRKDGLTVEEEAIAASEPGSLEPGSPGSVRTLTLDLKPGRYMFFCNMEGHYLGGMHAEVVVD